MATVAFVLAAHGEEGAVRAVRRTGAAYWSDGSVVEGMLMLTPGSTFQLQLPPEGKEDKRGQVRTFGLEQVAEIAFVPFTLGYDAPERISRPFRFDTSGDRRTKIFEGEPFGIRELGATVRFADGEELFGILKPCSIYVEPGPEQRRSRDLAGMPATRKIVLVNRQQGKPGQLLSDLPYVTHVRLRAEATTGRSDVPLVLPPGSVGENDSVAAIVRRSLESVPVSRADGGLVVRGTLGENVLVAVSRADGSIDVGWPAPVTADDGLRAILEKAVAAIHDYHDERKVVGIVRDGPSRALALVSLRRRVPPGAAEETGEFDEMGDRIEFARASVWMFRYDEESSRAAVVRRGTFVRRRVPAGADTPAIRIAESLWPVVRDGDRITAGSADGGRRGGSP